MDAYDLVRDMLAEEAGEPYPYNRENIAAHGFPCHRAGGPRLLGFPQLLALHAPVPDSDQNDFVTTMAVF